MHVIIEFILSLLHINVHRRTTTMANFASVSMEPHNCGVTVILKVIFQSFVLIKYITS